MTILILRDVTVSFHCKMAAVQNAVNTAKENLEKWLEEKNFFTDLLGKVEEKTKVKKLHQFLGSYCSFCCAKRSFVDCPCSQFLCNAPKMVE